MSQQPAPATPARAHASEKKLPDRVLLVPYPKFVFLYPTLIAAYVVAIYLQCLRDPLDTNNPHAVAATVAFLGVFFVNMVILAFDFPRATTLTGFFILVTLVLALWLLFTFKPHLLPAILDTLKHIRPVANPTFYWVFAVVFTLLFIGVNISVRLDYWEVQANELVHHHGFLADLERLPSPHVRFKKETNDLFEYLLLGSGRLTLHFGDDKRDDVVLDNVLWLNRKEPHIMRMLGVLEVEMRSSQS